MRSQNTERPQFLITIDTEGDNLWSRPREITTRNSRFLPRFQSLCESYGLKPTYLTDFEMANCPDFQEFGRDVLKRQVGEIGMHLHAWNTPPLIPLTSDDNQYQPYLTEYPEAAMRDKIACMTDLLEDTFELKMTSHRGGRWSFNKLYVHILIQKGYRVDCSVTPGVSWKRVLGDPSQSGGPDYSHFPDSPYFLDLEDISKPGHSPLLEVPVTITSTQSTLVKRLRGFCGKRSLPGRALNHFFPPVCWLRPNGKNLSSMMRILKQATKEKRSYVEFMLHSSELMPGGSPTFPRHENIESLYDFLEELFDRSRDSFQGATLTEFCEEFTER